MGERSERIGNDQFWYASAQSNQRGGMHRLPIRTLNLTEELAAAIQRRVDSGQYQSAGDVVRSAFQALQREEWEDEAKLSRLRAAIDAGDASGTFEGDPFGQIYEAIQRARQTAKRIAGLPFAGSAGRGPESDLP